MKQSTFIGTSGFSYQEWKPAFYPADLSTAKMLGYYSRRLPTVEINNTFYRMPNPANLLKWAAEVPGNFLFTFKAPQIITHIKRLRGVEKDVKYFAEATAVLNEQLG